MAKKKAFVVYPRTKEMARAGIETKKGKRKFQGGSFMNVNANEAAEIKDTYGKQSVHVVEDEQLARALSGEKWDVQDNKVKTLHNYFFAMPSFNLHEPQDGDEKVISGMVYVWRMIEGKMELQPKRDMENMTPKVEE